MKEVRVYPLGWLVRQCFGMYGFWGKFIRLNYPELTLDMEKNYSKISQTIDQEGVLISAELYIVITKICEDYNITDNSIKDTLCLVVEVMKSSLEYQKKNELSKTALGFKDLIDQIKALRAFLNLKVHNRSLEENKKFPGEYIEIRYKNVPIQAPLELGKTIFDVIQQYTLEKEEYYKDELTWKKGQWDSLYAFNRNSDKEIMRFRKLLMKNFLSFLGHLELGGMWYDFKPVILSPVQQDLFIGKLFILAGILPSISASDIPKSLRKQGKSTYTPEDRLLQQRMSSLRNKVKTMFKLNR